MFVYPIAQVPLHVVYVIVPVLLSVDLVVSVRSPLFTSTLCFGRLGVLQNQNITYANAISPVLFRHVRRWLFRVRPASCFVWRVFSQR